ncbi:MAG TPA: ABC transporter permease [Steroidobacteraceae bacterium]|nr:ABC transporter permease [Steroidobacteraceae bacterium]
MNPALESIDTAERRVLNRWRFLDVVYRNYRVWRKMMVSALVNHLADPLVWLVGLGYGLGRLLPNVGGMSYMEFLASGILPYSVMNSASFEALWSAFTRLKFQRTWESILNAPMTVSDIVLGEWVWAALKGAMSGVAILLVMTAFGLVKSFGALWVLPVILLTGMAFAGVALVVTSLAKSYDLFSFYFSLAIMPMMLVSGIYFPIDQLPGPLQVIAQILPLSHAVTLSRGIVAGAPLNDVVLHLGVLAAYGAAGLFISDRLIRRRLAK